MKVHVLTAVSRPWNLGAMAESLIKASRHAPAANLTWHCRFDPKRRHVGGQALKNEMLDEIADGWIIILDDDTLMHEHFLKVAHEWIGGRHNLAAIVFSQQRTDGRVLEAAPENVVVSSIDAGQVVLNRGLIADHRLPESYAGDGQWLEMLLRDRDDVYYVPMALSLHNILTGIDVSETPERMQA